MSDGISDAVREQERNNSWIEVDAFINFLEARELQCVPLPKRFLRGHTRAYRTLIGKKSMQIEKAGTLDKILKLFSTRLAHKEPQAWIVLLCDIIDEMNSPFEDQIPQDLWERLKAVSPFKHHIIGKIKISPVNITCELERMLPVVRDAAHIQGVKVDSDTLILFPKSVKLKRC